MVIEAGSPEAVKALIAARMGYSIMSAVSVVKEMKLGQLVKCLLSPKLTRPVCVAYPKERIYSRLTISFVSFAKEGLSFLIRDSCRRSRWSCARECTTPSPRPERG